MSIMFSLNREFYLWIIILILVLFMYWQESTVKERIDIYNAVGCSRLLFNMSNRSGYEVPTQIIDWKENKTLIAPEG